MRFVVAIVVVLNKSRVMVSFPSKGPFSARNALGNPVTCRRKRVFVLANPGLCASAHRDCF